MAGNRKTILATGEIYHVFNRGVDRRTIFTRKNEYQHFLETMSYYRFQDLPLRFSKFLDVPILERQTLKNKIIKHSTQVDILAYCLMPNHFHLMLRQLVDDGISRFISLISNSYSKHYNIKHNRVGSLLQGPFRDVRVETEKQFVGLTRYIHLNPTSSFLIKEAELDTYQWSSFPEYLGKSDTKMCETKTLLSMFKSINSYHDFVHDQVEYAQELDQIKHLAIDVEEQVST